MKNNYMKILFLMSGFALINTVSAFKLHCNDIPEGGYYIFSAEFDNINTDDVHLANVSISQHHNLHKTVKYITNANERIKLRYNISPVHKNKVLELRQISSLSPNPDLEEPLPWSLIKHKEHGYYLTLKNKNELNCSYFDNGFGELIHPSNFEKIEKNTSDIYGNKYIFGLGD